MRALTCIELAEIKQLLLYVIPEGAPGNCGQLAKFLISPKRTLCCRVRPAMKSDHHHGTLGLGNRVADQGNAITRGGVGEGVSLLPGDQVLVSMIARRCSRLRRRIDCATVSGNGV
jgi:hypothetical protein